MKGMILSEVALVACAVAVGIATAWFYGLLVWGVPNVLIGLMISLAQAATKKTGV